MLVKLKQSLSGPSKVGRQLHFPMTVGFINRIGQNLGLVQSMICLTLDLPGDFHDKYRNFYFQLLRQSGDRQKLRIRNSLTKLFDSQEGCLGKAEGWDRKGRELLYCIRNRTRGGIHCQIYPCISC